MNPLSEKFKDTRLLLGSNSPRRKQLFSELGLDFEVMVKDVDENVSMALRPEDLVMFLARKKGMAYKNETKEGAIVITADTIVALGDKIIGKPSSLEEAKELLNLLSGKKHMVITGVAIMSDKKAESFFVRTEVCFKTLRPDEIEYYVNQFQPLDKAGAYGIQEWIGMIGIEYIHGSYYNVMGLPVKELYEQLRKF
ncbi:MAG: Maf family nucleotide pyrophosphatase [Bacteroidota bacterium]